jgi:Zn-dependent protease
MRVLGFPVHVRPGFLFFMVLIVALYRDEFGLYLAGAIAVFTLLHELGHAVAARRAGATAEISLDFLAGYASYTTPKPLSNGTEAAIALAGPVTHITSSLLVLYVMGIDPFDAFSRGSTDAAAAVWWAGPVIGAFNLLPVLPLDGGNVVTSLLDRVAPGRARPFMVYASLAATIAAAVVFAFSVQYRGFVIFVGLLLVMQLQMLFEERSEHAVSPFDKAMAALDRGDESKARRIATNGLRRPGAGLPVPRAIDGAGVHRLLAVLPRPLPYGDPWNEYVLTNLLVSATEYREAATYGAESFARQPQLLLAATIARAAAALGDQETAVAWLRAAADTTSSTRGLAAVIDQAPELAAVRSRSDVVALRASLQPTG